ncbi:MAG TPA: AAA family ATPase [Candidatus Kapabacteria bacterium]|nr:AAA family ATPase [Candidatus Kapabacteria bacterium]
MSPNRTKDPIQFLPKLLEAALSGDRRRLELLALTAIRALKSEYPNVSAELGAILASANGQVNPTRGRSQQPAPSDSDIGLALVQVLTPDIAPEPVLPPSLHDRVYRFLNERIHSRALLSEGFSPPGLILLKGAPGTGKTMLARWLAHRLDLNLVILDLSTSISSFLGKTGNNLRRSFDYARSGPCVLLLDEFDAIAKRRDDETEVGELKRIVNVLLKEMENWPMHSVLVAATNHPELLDPAIHRRFDVVLDIPVPGQAERTSIIIQSCGRFGSDAPTGLVSALSTVYAGSSGSEIETEMRAMIRKHLLDNTPLEQCFLDEIRSKLPTRANKKYIGSIIRSLRDDTKLTVRGIAEIVGLSSTAVQHHLNKDKEDG